MPLSAWIILGLISGLLAGNIVNGVSPDVVMDVILGCALLVVAYYAVSRYTKPERGNPPAF